jgi:hypothetical protein
VVQRTFEFDSQRSGHEDSSGCALRFHEFRGCRGPA